MLYFIFFELLLVSLLTWSSVHCVDRLVRRKVLVHQSLLGFFTRAAFHDSALFLTEKIKNKRQRNLKKEIVDCSLSNNPISFMVRTQSLINTGTYRPRIPDCKINSVYHS